MINNYNPCKNLELNKLTEIEGQDGNSAMWCVDFNAHSTMWGSNKTDNNGQVLEELLEERNLVCVNDVNKTQTDIRSGKESVLDLTLVTNNLSRGCDWKVLK